MPPPVVIWFLPIRRMTLVISWGHVDFDEMRGSLYFLHPVLGQTLPASLVLSIAGV